ncbi:MAG: type IV toxin-antitoxin system AbiEi family antitoxin domain-containing protein [Tetrasphaera sp.]|nr:type IV toxin-antitoxin system AbiEi family antitoxin domain-containing protein [Tetrasphaera sp.]
MDSRLRTLAQAQSGVFSVDDAARVGITANELTTLVRAGELVRVRRGAYVLSAVFDGADLSERYRLRVLAVLRTRPATDRASHQSALAMFQVPFYGAPTDVVMVEASTSSRQRSGLYLHARSSHSGRAFLGNLHAVSPEVACVQIAARYGFEAGVCAMDSALHLSRCTREGLEAALEQLPVSRRRTARLAIAAAQPLAESVGESRLRIILQDAGFAVRSQVQIVDGDDRFVGRVDFLVDDVVVVEFDGLTKYADLDGRRVLADEKARESRLSRLGFEVERVVWRDLDRPELIVQRVTEARLTALNRRAAMAR